MKRVPDVCMDREKVFNDFAVNISVSSLTI